MTAKIKVIDYTGCFPSLCFGTLVLEVNGKRYELEKVLESGGYCGFGESFSDEIIEKGDWIVDAKRLPVELKPLSDEIEKAVNEQLECRGCCGGCI